MKYLLLISIFLLASNLFSQTRLLTARDCAVMIDARVTINDKASITLSWNNNEQANKYIIFRKELGAYFPNNPIVELDSNVYDWTDENVQVGKIYEYKIVGVSKGLYNSGNGQAPIDYLAVGYKAVSVNASPYKGGRLLILIDSTYKESLKSEIERFQDDIIKEGWTYVTHYVPRAETFDGKKVKQVKQIVLQEWGKQQFDNIFLFGRVPVPYSGDIVPDGHVNNHRGAWPADMYYGNMNENYWTDISVNSTTAPDRTKNIPGDGKFDISELYNSQGQIVIPTHAGVGRVDFFDLPAFEKNELELLRAYLNKDHNFRTGQFEIVDSALVDNNFAAYSLLGAFAWSGWANFSSIIGKDNVVAGDWIKNTRPENLQDKTYLMAFGDGGGSYTSSSGVGTSADFAKNKLNAVFSILFGSYFGDWDVKDNLMRSALASEPSILTCSWAGRPHWFYHHLGLDFPIGYSVKTTLNNTLDYVPNLIINNGQPTFPEGLSLLVHTSLLGDPSLKVNASPIMSDLESFSAVQEGEDTKLTWEMPSDGEEHKWDLFYSVDLSDKWFKANEEPVTTNEFFDDFRYNGKITYLIREIITEADGETSNGSNGYLNRYSRGNIATIVRSDVNSVEESNFSFDIAPNPAIDEISINFRSATNYSKISIYDLAGVELKSFEFNSIANSQNSINWGLIGKKGKLTNGVYIIKFSDGKEVISKKFIVNR